MRGFRERVWWECSLIWGGAAAVRWGRREGRRQHQLGRELEFWVGVMEGGSFSWGGQHRGWWDPRAVGGSDRPPSPGRWEQGKPQQPWPGGPSSSSSAWQEALGGKGAGGEQGV